MSKLPQISGQDLVRALEKRGFRVRRQQGSHLILRRDDPFAQTVVPNHRQIVGQKEWFSQKKPAGWLLATVLRAWNITPALTELLATPPGFSRDRLIDGMFYDHLVGSFCTTNDLKLVSINWQTGPRFGRGYIHVIEQGPNGTLIFGPPESTWMS